MRSIDRRRLRTSIAGADRRLERAAACGHSVSDEAAEALAERCVSFLSLGELDKAWLDYERCVEVRDRLGSSRSTAPRRWRGEALNGGSFYLQLTDGGFGDLIQCSRFVPEVVERSGATVIGQTRPELLRLFSQSFDSEIRWTAEESSRSGWTRATCDAQVAWYHLPLLLRETQEDIERRVPYLRAAPRAIQRWQRRLLSDLERSESQDGRATEACSKRRRRKARVGLCWSNSMPGEWRKPETLELARTLPLFGVSDTIFVALQKGGRSEGIAAAGLAGRLIDYGQEVGDFADQAALISVLDLVVTIDTSIAHLAGALGKPVWLVLLEEPDMRWLSGRDARSTWWYPSVHKFFQPPSGEWHALFEELSRRLSSRLRRPEGPRFP